MPIGTTLAVIQAILAAGKLGAGIYSLTQADKIPKELQEVYDLYREQATKGLPAGIESRLLNQGVMRINRMASARQNVGAMAQASRGTGISSAADASLDRVSQMAFEELGNLQSDIALMDAQVRAQALPGLASVGGTIAGIKEEKRAAASKLVGSGIMDFFDQDMLAELGIIEPVEDPLQGLMDMLDPFRQFNRPSSAVPLPDDMQDFYNQYFKFG